ncbi:hypothetical protein CRG98_049942 [Punica granatum]|uniref:Uncharacterized protein n=1 Tax=Punica granatum TaxID=22663 RepID=A0A2I0H1J6_PUNGR|nr:hypothetical protein CRG98_049942 [Punica granatum]
MRRSGAETKVGGLPVTTMGFKPPIALLIVLSTKEEEEEEVSRSLRGWWKEGCGAGNKFRQREAMEWLSSSA